MLRTCLFLELLALVVLLPTTVQAGPPTHLPDKEEPINLGLGPAPQELDRSTPLKSWSTLLTGCQQGRWGSAAQVLNLGEIPKGDQKTLGAVVARKLCEVLKVVGRVERAAEGLDDSELGPIVQDKPTNYVVVASIEVPGVGQGAIWLRRFKDTGSGQHVWVVTRRTVSEIPTWHQVLVKKERVGREAVEVINPGLGPIPAGLKLQTPRDAITTFTKLTRQGKFAEAARMLDLSDYSAKEQAEQGRRLTRRLSIILKRIHPGGFGRLSNDPMGMPEKGVPVDQEVVARTDLEGQAIQLRLARYPRVDAPAVWLFSRITVGDIDALYKTFGYGWAGDYLPPVFFEWMLWKIQLWQWLGMLLALLFGLIFGILASFVMRKLLLRLATMTRWDWDDEVVKTMRGPLVGVFWALGFAALLPFLALSAGPRAFLFGMCKLVAILSLGWLAMRLMDVAGDQLMRVFKEREDDLGLAMVPVARKILKPILFVIILILALQNIGMNVGGLLAGLGIGGLAFALAAKDTLANVFGSVAIAFDRPFKVGEFIKVGDIMGTVEDVGLRSTKLRTLDRTVITVPNSQMADSKVENFAKRERIRLVATFGVQYDTSLDQVRYIVDEFKRYLLAHPRVYPDGWRVRFVGYASSSLDIEVYCYIDSSDFTEFTGIREQILMGLGDIITAAGAEFAYPSQTVYVGKDSAADAKKAKMAATEVARRTEAGELCIPDIPDKVREALQVGRAQPET